MKRVLALAASLIALIAAAPLAQAKDAPPAATAVSVAPIAWRHRTLANGLEVYSIQDRRSPNVAVQVWYRVGSKDDPAGRSGFAHLFEHMMFKATRNMPSEYFDRITEDVGGLNNASTNDDYTEYHEVVPANYLQTALWAEAERMGSLVVDDAAFKSERDVVKEEFRQRVLAQPYGKLFSIDYPELSFSVSPYGRPGIGSIADLDSATVQDVQAFHATYYRPDNAVLVVAGDFDQAQLDAWVDHYLGVIARPSGPVPRVSAVEPARSGPTRRTVYEPNTPLPAVLITYPFPAASSPDIPALIVADAILSKGESSRFYRSLVYDQQLATQALSVLELRQQPGAYGVGAVLAEGKSAKAGEAALEAEIARLRDQPVTAAELARAKRQLITDALQQRETVAGQAEELENAVVLYGDADKANRLVSDLQAVTPEDVRRVARKYFADDQRAVLHYLPDDKKPADAIAYAPAATIKAQTLFRPADLKVVEAAPVAERIMPPAPSDPVAVPDPKPVERTLPNGLRVVVSPNHDVPLVTAQMMVDAGSAADPADLPGTAEMSSAILTKGTRTRSAAEVSAAIESLGGSLNASASYDGSTLSLTVAADALNPAMDVFADVARHPAFAKDELDRARLQVLNDLEVQMHDPSALAGYAAARAAYGAAPYGRPANGTIASLGRMTPADAQAFHDTWWRPDNATLVLSGDLTPDQGFALAQRLFGDWARPAAPLPAIEAPAGHATAARVIVVDLPKAGQAAVVVVRPSLARADERYYPAVLANSVLGGGYSGRLNQEVRVKRGLSYGAYSAIAFRKGAGPLSASTQTKNESAPEVVELILAEMKGLGDRPVTAEELKARQAAIVGGFGRRSETTDDMASLLGGLSLYRVDLGEVGRYADRIKAVTPEQVSAVAKTVFDPAQASVVVVGDASLFLPALKAKYPNLEVIQADQFDLDSPTMRKP
jgi:zinc protease